MIPGNQSTDILGFYLPHHSVLIIAQSMTKLLIAGCEIGCFCGLQIWTIVKKYTNSLHSIHGPTVEPRDLETITPNGPLRGNTGKEGDQQGQWFIFAVTSWAWMHEVSHVLSLLPDLGRKSPESSAGRELGREIQKCWPASIRKLQCRDLSTWREEKAGNSQYQPTKEN